MRILPASCWWAGAPSARIIDNLGAASALTHAHIRSRVVCALHGVVVDRLLAHATIAQALTDAGRLLAPSVPDTEREGLAPLLDASCLEWPRHRVPSDGHVVSTFIAACWCLHQHPDFASAVLAAVNLGEDTDTTAAVTGGLAGLRCGLSGIPHAWLACLPRRVEVVALAETFAEACLRRPAPQP
jgi:ADP-ribosyl-[dinitrogen reductase] hydrolase